VGGDGIAGQSGQQLNPLLRVSSLKDALALIGVPKTSRDMKKDCDKPGCPTDHRRQVLARGDEDRMTSADGTKRTSPDVRPESAFGGKAENIYSERVFRLLTTRSGLTSGSEHTAFPLGPAPWS